MRTTEIRRISHSPSPQVKPNQEPVRADSDYEPESQFDQFPDSIPETQLPSQPFNPAIPPAAVNHRTSSRLFRTMKWKPSGAIVCLDLNLPLDEILETLQDIGSEGGLE